MSEVLDKEATIQKLERAYQVAERASFLSCLEYLKHVVINSIPPRPFREVAEPWQWALNSRIIPAVEYSAQVRKQYQGPLRYYIVLPKGHDKTSFVARILSWSLAFSHVHLTSFAAARDKEQAGLLADAMMIEANLNPWIKKYIKFKNWTVSGRNDSKLHILAADAEGSAGIRGDLVIMDELTQWKSQKFFDHLLAGVNKRADTSKRSRCTLIIISNAGVRGSWQWDVLQMAKESMVTNGLWWVYEAPHQLATWMPKDAIDDTRRMLPPAMAKMLYDNIWVDPTEDSAYVTREQVQVCEDDTFLSEERTGPCYAAIDYGPVKDRTVMTVLRRVGDVLYVEDMTVLQGSKENHVPIASVEAWTAMVREKYKPELLVVDKYQLEQFIQNHKHLIPIEVFEPRSSMGNYAMASNMRTLILEKRLRWPKMAGALKVIDRDGRERIETFSEELCSVSVKLQPNGYRLINMGNSHDDRCCSAAMGALYAIRANRKRDLWLNDNWF